MERTEVLEMMGELKLYGMKSAYDEVYATALKRQHEPQRLVGDLLKAEISEKHARSIRYQLAIAKLPLAKDVDDFQFKSTPINENLVRDLACGGFIAQQRNVVLVGGTEPDSQCSPRHVIESPRAVLVDLQTPAASMRAFFVGRPRRRPRRIEDRPFG